MTGKRGRRRGKLLDDLKERRGYCHLKEEALDRSMWRARFGRGFGPVVRQTSIRNKQWIVLMIYEAVKREILKKNSSETRQAVWIQNSVARSLNNCCRGRAISITYSECASVVLGIQHSKHMRRAKLWSEYCLAVPCFSTLIYKRHDFLTKNLIVKPINLKI